ncbi:MAG TPA: carboxypeptidase-like regulatory domain-containing protein [Candidatus Acidoferrum sp.]|nr:carboxypeptidase-like regulatory domain-containing protein [Candidatus Acidoferrum sp.]
MSYTFFRSRFLLAMILVVVPLLSAKIDNICAQDMGKTTPSTGDSSQSSEKPQPQSEPQSVSAQAPAAEPSTRISGEVQDETGAKVAGAEVSLVDAKGSRRSTVASGPDGNFAFEPIPPGSYRVLINAKDLEPFESAEILVTVQEAYKMPPILLRVATANTQMTVRPIDVVAAEEIKAEEQQRLIGIVPNFYTVYIYDAAPLTTRQKFSLATHSVFDPFELASDGINAGIAQAKNSYPGYEQGTEGYSRRYAAAFGDSLTRNYLSRAVLPSLFHQDPRYFYQGSGSTKSRLVHALKFTVELRGDNGRNMPNYSFFIGTVGSGLISNLYYPHADRGASLVFTNLAISLAERAGESVFREFVSKRFTKNVPPNAKP